MIGRTLARYRITAVLGVVLVASLPYLNGLRNGFTFDDVTIVAENPRLRSLEGLRHIATDDWWGGKREQSLLYRPLTMASFAADYALSRVGATDAPPARLPDRAARAFHVGNLLWHAAASVGFFLLVLEMFQGHALAVAAGALFAVHPVHSEAVNGIVGRAELMSACFLFFALLAAWRVTRDDSRSSRLAVVAGILVLLAALSKEHAVLAPIVPLLWLLPRTSAERRETLRRRSFRVLLASMALGGGAYVAARAAVLGSLTGIRAAGLASIDVDNAIATAHGAARLLTPIRVFGHVLRLLLFPRTLSADYSYDQIPVVSSLDAATAACFVALCGLVTLAFFLRRRAVAVSFGILFGLLTWSLTSNLPFVIGTILGERLLYLPSAGACLAIASGVLVVSRRLPATRVAAVVLACLVLLGAARTFTRNRDWKDDLSLFRSAAQVSPRSCKALDSYASELFTQGRAREAVSWAERSLGIHPGYADAHLTLAKSYRILAGEEADPARREELRAKVRDHGRALLGSGAATNDDGLLADTWNVLGALALDEGKLDEALADYRKSLEHDRESVASFTGLGVVYVFRARGEADPRAKDALHEEALRQFEQALSRDPANPEANQNASFVLHDLASRAADPVRRADLLRRAGEREGHAIAKHAEKGDASAIANLHGAHANQLLEENRYPEALAEFREAARLEPNGARSFLGIGAVLLAQAGAEQEPAPKRALVLEAIRSFEHALELEPKNPTAHLDLGIASIELRDAAKVAEHFRAYLRLAPDAPDRVSVEQTIRRMDEILARDGGRGAPR